MEHYEMKPIDCTRFHCCIDSVPTQHYDKSIREWLMETGERSIDPLGMLSSTGTTLTPPHFQYWYQSGSDPVFLHLPTFQPPLRLARILSQTDFQTQSSLGSECRESPNEALIHFARFLSPSAVVGCLQRGIPAVGALYLPCAECALSARMDSRGYSSSRINSRPPANSQSLFSPQISAFRSS